MIVTVNLAKGAIAMSREKVIVKRLNAIQNFGAMDVLCTDKTGTLTQDRIILKRHLDINGDELRDACCEYAYLNSHLPDGAASNLLDNAVLEHANCSTTLGPTHSYTQNRRNSVRFRPPPDVGRRRRDETSGTADLQGRGRRDLRRLHAMTIGETRSRRSTHAHLRSGQEVTTALNADGFRVIAVAYKEIRRRKPSIRSPTRADLSCWATSPSSIRRRRRRARRIAALREPASQVKILTGDNELVTRKICQRRRASTPDSIVAGQRNRADMSDDELAEVAGPTRRSSPGSRPRRRRASSRALQRKATWSASSATASTTARR